MSDQDGAEAAQTKRRQGRRRRLRGLFIVLSVLGICLAGLFYYAADRVIPMPGWLANQVEKQMNAALSKDAAAQIGLGGIGLMIDNRGVPRVLLRDVVVLTDDGVAVARMDAMRARLARRAFFSGRIELQALYLTGATVEVTRAPDGSLNMAIGETGAASGTIGDLIDAVDRAFTDPVLSGLDELEATDLTFKFSDRRSQREMTATGGALRLTQEERGLTARFTIGLSSDGSAPAETLLKIETDRDSPVAYLSATIGEVATADLAGQSPAFAFLSVLDAPLSGTMRAVIGESGRIDTIDGTMQIEQGYLRPTEAARPVSIRGGRTYFSYDREASEVEFTEVSVDTEAASIAAAGKTYLLMGENSWPSALVGQFSFTKVEANPYGALSEAATFGGGAADIRLKLDPFTLDIGQLVLAEGEQRFKLSGQITADETGWTTALDLSLNTILHDQLLALWPLELAPKTRDWLVDNIRAGTITDVTGAVRSQPGATPYVSVGYDFDAAEVQFMRSLPPITMGAGHSTLSGNTYSLVLDAGEIIAPDGGRIDVAGTTFRIPDMREKPARVEIGLEVDGDVPSTLSLLDLPPFELMSRAQRSTDLAVGEVSARADIRFRLGQRLSLDAVDYTVEAGLRNVRSETLIPGRILESEGMTLRANPDAIEIGGPGLLDGVPFDAAWTRRTIAGAGSSIEGTVELSPRFLEAFGIGLPPGSVSGQGEAVIEIGLPAEGVPDFRLRSDLAQIGLRIDALGWSKPETTPGRLRVEGRLGPKPSIDTLEVEGPGFSASGSVAVTETGQLEQARFQRVQVGRWLNAPMTLTGRGSSAPSVQILGGSLDLRSANFGGGDGNAGGPITLALDRLVITDALALTDVNGVLTGRGGIAGRLTGQLNGAAPISAVLSPTAEGPSIRVLSEDAGQVLRAAGFFQGARRGSLEMTLNPLGAQGFYDGVLNIQGIRLRDAPAVADILAAISVVGLVEQLDGEGIVFSDVDARFRLTPEQLILLQSSAIGPSMGISLDGIYDLGSKVMDMQGVVSPIYMLNAVGSIFSRNREGLFGFNFRVRGPIGDANVTVNPLSILTPGMFREIFRRPPPKVSAAQ